MGKHNHIAALGILLAYSIIAAIQLVLGTGVISIFFMMLCAGSIALIVLAYGLYNISSLLAVALLSKYSLVPFLLKTIIGEPIDQGLYAAEESFLVLTLGTMIVCLALLLANSIPVKRKVLAISLSPSELRRYGFIFFTIGFGFALLHIQFQPRFVSLGRQTAGFGGFGEFSSLMFLGIILYTNYLVTAYKNKSISLTIIIMLGLALLISLFANQKFQFFMAVLSYLSTLFLSSPGFFRSKKGFKFLGYTTLLLIFFVSIVAPAIHAMRLAGIYKELTITDRIEFILSGDIWRQETDYALSGNSVLFNYLGAMENHLVDRLSMVEDLDLIVSGAKEGNLVGFEPIILGIKNAIPSFLQTDKPAYNDGALIGYRQGLASFLGGWLVTVGVFSVSYAMFLWPGWMVVVFFIYLTWFLILRKLVHADIRNNTWAIYVLIKYGFLFTENSVQAMVLIMIRNLPIDILTIYLILFIGTRFRLKKGRDHTGSL